MRLACVQFHPEFGAAGRNLDRIRAMIPPAQADLVALPELCTTGYAFADRDELGALAEAIPDGPSTAALVDIARATGAVICAGLAERAGERLFNSAVLVGPGGYVGRYRKIHLFDRENALFDRGDLGFPTFDAAGARLGIMICFDWWYPESARALTLAGAQVILHPSNIVMPYCQSAMRVRCLENHVIAATANRVGEETRAGATLRFTGRSQITGFKGEVLASAGGESEAWIDADVEPWRASERGVGSVEDFMALRSPAGYAGW
jgi:predicted amidohydrolase